LGGCATRAAKEKVKKNATEAARNMDAMELTPP
jgi:hypothetical protein